MASGAPTCCKADADPLQRGSFMEDSPSYRRWTAQKLRRCDSVAQSLRVAPVTIPEGPATDLG